jgi:hypothetical protein
VRSIGQIAAGTSPPLPLPVEPQPKRGTYVAAAIALSAFGPYLFSGFRTEQVTVYAAFAVLLLGGCWIKARPSGHGLAVAALLVVQLTFGLVSAIDPPQNTTIYQLGDPLAGIDNFALPVAVIGAMWMLLAIGADRERMIRVICWITVWAMVINAGLAISATGGDGPNLAIFQGQAEGQSVAYLAEQLGRFSGIFNQPAEAGLMNSVALLAAIYLYRRRASLLALTGTAICIGGVLTVSKTFLFVGLPLGLWQTVRATGTRQRRLAAVLAMVMLIWGAAKSGLTPEWTGGKFLIRLMPGGNQGAVDLYTAGRFGEDSTLAVVTEQIMASAPALGFGAGGLREAYDNAWVEALATGGLLGAGILTTVLVVLVYAWWCTRSTVSNAESRFAGGLVVVVLGAAVGVPALTINRCSTIVWALLALTVLGVTQRSSAKGPLALT